MSSPKCCCPAVNGLRRMRPLVGVLAISYKEDTTRALSLIADRGGKTTGGDG